MSEEKCENSGAEVAGSCEEMEDLNAVRWPVGQFLHATVGGVDAVVYRSMILEKGDPRTYCYRYNLPWSPQVPRELSVTITGVVDTSEYINR